MNYLESSILGTIIYYNNLGQPLTSFEVYKYLIKPKNRSRLTQVLNNGYGFLEVWKCLEKSLYLKEFIQHKNGLYFLIGKESLIHQRIVKNRIAIKKWKRVKRTVKILQIVPFLKMIVVSGSLAVNNTRKKSDIDLLIIAKHKRIWLTRTLITLIIQILGSRRHKKLTANRFCLNHYITDESLNIPFQSLYNAQTYARLVLIHQKDNEDFFARFQKSNTWLKEYLFNYGEQKINLHTVKNNAILIKIAKFFEYILEGYIGDILEKTLGIYQSYRISRDPLTAKIGGRVAFNDNQLEFHPDSPELKIINSYNKKTFDFGLLEYTNQADSGLTK